MKGVILAAGKGTRLYPLSKAFSKTLLPVYDKPMIYYTISTLLDAGIKDIEIITTKEDLPLFEKMIGDGSQFGVHFCFDIQYIPKGTADAVLIAEKFIGDDSFCLIFGDNLFYGEDLAKIMEKHIDMKSGAVLYTYEVENPKAFGVCEFDKNGNVLSIEEKPENPKSNFAVTGMYMFDNTAIKKAKTLTPSKRGEIEITDLINLFLDEQKITVEKLEKKSYIWLDTGNSESLFSASNTIKNLQKSKNRLIGSIEEICYRKKYIDTKQFLDVVTPQLKTNYGKYLENLVDKK